MIDYRPLRSRGEVMLESFNTPWRTLSESLNRAIRTVAHVTDNLMSRRCSLREETITNPLHFTSNKKLSRYLHLKSSPSFPFSNVNVSASASSNFNVSVIVLPLIEPV